MTKEDILVLAIRALPEPDAISAIHFNKNTIRFDWNGTRYRVSERLFVEEVDNGILRATDRAILVSQLLKNQRDQ